MSMYHAAYLFHPVAFAEKILAISNTVGTDAERYDVVRGEALQNFDTNPVVRKLASEYGGWDRKSILTPVPTGASEDQETVAFWLTLILYSYLTQDVDASGLGSIENLTALRSALADAGWQENDIHLVTYGRTFSDFGRLYAFESKQTPLFGASCWRYIGTFSQSAGTGWLDYSEIEKLYGAFVSSIRGLRSSGQQTTSALDAARRMLVSAQDKHVGLYIVVSG